MFPVAWGWKICDYETLCVLGGPIWEGVLWGLSVCREGRRLCGRGKQSEEKLVKRLSCLKFRRAFHLVLGLRRSVPVWVQIFPSGSPPLR